jgi:hypothetical protein
MLPGSARPIVVAVLVLGAASCTRRIEAKPDEQRADAGPPPACTKPAKDAAVVEIPARCAIIIDESRHVGPGQRFSIGPGAIVTFAPGTSIVVDGGTFTARGTSAEPVLLTSAAPDDWSGLIFGEPPGAKYGEPTSPESVIEHAVIEHAPVSTVGAAARLRLSNVVFRSTTKGTALTFAFRESFVSATHLSFDRTGTAIDAHPAVIALITDTRFTHPVRLHGEVRGEVVLPAVEAGFIADTLYVNDGATLTFPAGVAVKMSRDAAIEVNGLSREPGGLLKRKPTAIYAKNVTFTSNAVPPATGDWRGFALDESSSTFEGCIIEHTGASYVPPRGAIHFASGHDDDTVITKTTFRHNAGPGIEAATSCAKLAAPASGNTSVGGPLCAVSPPP